MRTFKIGGVHPHDKKIASDCPIEQFPIQSKAYLPLSQHIGATAQDVVAVGDKVLVGQLIAQAGGFVSSPIHSSVSGTVSAIGPVKDFTGRAIPTITIDVEGDEWDPSIDRSPDIVRECALEPKEIIAKISAMGVVGLGGASFPTHVKLSPPPGKKAECLIINGAECEPYLTSDYRLLIEHPEEIVIGATIMMKALGVKRGYIAIEENKPEAIALLTKTAASYEGVEVVKLRKKYPQGGEKQLIDAVTGRRVPSMGLPIDAGAVVQNVGTSFAVYEAVQKNKPLFEGVVTVTGDCVKNRGNWLLRAGTPYQALLDSAGELPVGALKLISGGPMMGRTIVNPEGPTVKSTSALLVLTAEQTSRQKETGCIRCGKCIDACPMGLEPYLLNKLARLGRYDEMEALKIADCIECGCCLYSCPAYMPLLDNIRIAKAEVIKRIRARAVQK